MNTKFLIALVLLIIIFFINEKIKKRVKYKKSIAYLRTQVKYYQVQETKGLFGDFSFRWYEAWYYGYRPYIIVLATSPLNAVKRAQKRGYGKNRSIREFGDTSQWAKFRVKELQKSDHSRNVFYF